MAPRAAKAKASQPPPNPALPLTGLTFVFTGEMDELSRPEAEEKVKQYGAKTTTTVSGKTSFLVAGSRLEGGGGSFAGANMPTCVEETSKYKKASEFRTQGKPIQILTEPEFLQKIKDAEASAAGAVGASAGAASAGASSSAFQPQPIAKAVSPSGGGSVANSSSAGGPASSSAVPASSVPAAVQKTLAGPKKEQPWVLKYAPKTLEDLQGHQTGARKLVEWLKDWDDVVLRGNKKPLPPARGGGQPDNPNARGALITGPPGIGKTSCVKVVCDQFKDKFEAVWYNASSSRGKKAVEELAAGVAQVVAYDFSKPFGSGGNSLDSLNAKAKTTKRSLIIMDEADGMGAGDRGGTLALSKMIRASKNPVICIANESGKEQKMRTLAGACYELKFSRPQKGAIAKRVGWICEQEGVPYEPNGLEAMAEACGNDLRQVITQVQTMYTQGTGLSYLQIKDKAAEIEKDQTADAFGAAKKLLTTQEHKKLSYMEKNDLFFADYDMVPLLVQENYLKFYDSARVKSTDVGEILLEERILLEESICSCGRVHTDHVGAFSTAVISLLSSRG